MQRAVVVCTWSGGRDFTNLCLSNLKTNFPIVVVINDAGNSEQDWIDSLQEKYPVIPILENGYELGAIEAIYKYTSIEEFWLVQHTVQILDPEVFNIGFNFVGQSISYAYNQFENYLGKYVRNTLNKVIIPKVTSKEKALFYESVFHNAYGQVEGIINCIDKDFYSDNPDNYIEELFGEERFVEVGKYLLKRRSLSRESFNIPKYWSDDVYKTFLYYWRKGGKRYEV